MAKLVPNQNCWVGWVDTVPADIAAPTQAEIDNAEDLTCYLVSLNASAQGNTVPVPTLCTLFESTVPGTSSANFTADMYRDDEDDAAWDALPRGQSGAFIIGRLNLSGTTGEGKPKPATGDKVETWPITVTSRAAGPLTSNQAQTFSLVGSVPSEPAEDAVVGS